MPLSVLILGGTSEATALGRSLAGDRRFVATISLAGRTSEPAPQPLPTRIGGFGGVDGLARHLAEHRIAALVDATHPFAAQMTRHAEAAAREAGIPLLVVRRPPWRQGPGDRWIGVPAAAAAARALGTVPRRVLLTIGRKDLAPFAAAPWHHYVLRSVDPPPAAALPAGAEVIAARGPFAEADELALLSGRRIEMLVTKNSGATAVGAKLAAARALGLPVVMIARPPAPSAATVPGAAEALAWLIGHHASTPRGV